MIRSPFFSSTKHVKSQSLPSLVTDPPFSHKILVSIMHEINEKEGKNRSNDKSST